MTELKLQKAFQKLALAHRYCFMYGCNNAPVPHHLIGRDNKILRWDWRNCLPLCVEHHTGPFGIHKNGGEVYNYVIMNWPHMHFLLQLQWVDFKSFLSEMRCTKKEYYQICHDLIEDQIRVLTT